MSLALIAAAAVCGAAASEGAKRLRHGYLTAKARRQLREELESALANTEQVMLGDIVDFALPMHGKCSGRGFLRTSAPPHFKPCKCAEDRFIKRNSAKLCRVGGEIRWRKEHAPKRLP